MLSNWFNFSACKDCPAGTIVSGGVYCPRINEMIPVGYQGCKAMDELSEMRKHRIKSALTLEGLAGKLSMIFGFNYLTLEDDPYRDEMIIILWKTEEKLFFSEHGWLSTSTDSTRTVIPASLLPEGTVLNLSRYVDKNGNIDFSKCIVEVKAGGLIYFPSTEL